MSIKVITPAAEKPVTLDEVKEQLHIVDTNQDNMLNMYIAAATNTLEKLTNRAYVQRTIEVVLDAFPCSGNIEIPISPLLEIVSVKYDAEDGFEATVSPDDYTVDVTSTPGWVILNSAASWPATLDAVNAVRVRAIVGYDEASGPELAGNVPEEAKLCILFLVGTWFENRESVSPEQIQKIPNMLEDLAATLKVYR